MTNFIKTAGWLDWYKNPSKPKFQLPKGSVDSHCHVFGPANKFPFAKERKYTPCNASKDELFELRNFLGFDKNIIVQATCHGTDNSALLDALKNSQNKARGIASVSVKISDKELENLHEAGIRGVRFNFVKRLVDFTPKEDLLKIANKIKQFGWHIVIYFEASDLLELWEFFTKLPTIIVVDHMGRPDVTKNVDNEEFALFLKFMKENENIWSKVSCPERLTVNGKFAINSEENPYEDVIPFAKRVIEEFPDRVLWGTDWPHPNLKSHMPDDGLLVDFIPKIAINQNLQEKLLVKNPNKLYWGE